MKKSLLGAGFILLAVYILFRDILLLPDFGISLWTLLFVLGFGYGAVQNALRRNYTSAYVCGIIASSSWKDIMVGSMSGLEPWFLRQYWPGLAWG